MSKIGIVTVLYNSEKVLKEFFETLDQQIFKDFTLYIVDNASTDNSLPVAKELADTVTFPCKFFAESENWGVAKGNNIGIKAALNDNVDYVLLSNNDIVLKPDTISSLLDGLITMHADLAAPKIFYHDTRLIWYAGGAFTYFRGGTLHYGLMQPDHAKYANSSYVEYAPTCFILIKKQVFEKVGFMDEKYFVYYDDTDFIWRSTQVKGMKLVYVPQSTLLHKESASTGSIGSDFKIFYLNRNARYFANKNYRGIRKALTLLYSDLHTLIIKPFVYTRHQLEVYRKAVAEGKRMVDHK